MINLHERMLPNRRESNLQPPGHQSDAHPTEPPKPAHEQYLIMFGKLLTTRSCELKHHASCLTAHSLCFLFLFFFFFFFFFVFFNFQMQVEVASLLFNLTRTNYSFSLMVRVKRKSAFEHAQNAQIQIIRRMRKVSSGTLLSI